MKKSETSPPAAKEEEEISRKSMSSMIFEELKRVSYYKIDPRGALAFRVVFAFVAFYESLDFIWTPELMIDEGYVSREEHLHIYSQRYRDISILNAAGTPFACGLMIGTYVISSFTLAIGFHTRLSMFVVTLFLLSMNSRIGAMGFGGLGFVGIVSVYGNLVPNLEAYSVDKPHGTPSKSSVSNLAVTICITIHLSVMYYVCGMAKYVTNKNTQTSTLEHHPQVERKCDSQCIRYGQYYYDGCCKTR